MTQQISPEEATERLEVFDKAMELAFDILDNRGRTGARGATLFLAEALLSLFEQYEGARKRLDWYEGLQGDANDADFASIVRDEDGLLEQFDAKVDELRGCEAKCESLQHRLDDAYHMPPGSMARHWEEESKRLRVMLDAILPDKTTFHVIPGGAQISGDVSRETRESPGEASASADASNPASEPKP